MRRRSNRVRLVALALAALLALGGAALAPAVASAAPADGARAPKSQSLALWEQLGGRSRLCTDRSLGDIGADARRACNSSDSIVSPYPTDSYGLDSNVDVALTKPSTWISAVVQELLASVWLGLIYLVRGVLMLLEWAFTTDLYKASHSQTDGALARLYVAVSAPWMTFALSVAGLWGLWHGLVRRRVIETLGGLAAAVALMFVALVLISRPQETVGYFSHLANQTVVDTLSVGTTGTVAQPAKNLADANRAVFDSVILHPWCALEFGDVDYCTARRSGVTVADVWLTFPPDGIARQMLFKRTKSGDSTASGLLDAAGSIGWTLFGKADPGAAGSQFRHWYNTHKRVAKLANKVVTRSPAHVELQESSGTMRRFALFVIVAIGIVGAVAVFGSIAIRLLIDGGLMLLLLLLLAPLALLAPAFGEKGRKAFLTWGERLVGALATKLVFGVLMTIVMLLSKILAGLEQPLGGWLPCWFVETTFWWMLFLRRNELLGMLGMGGGRSRGMGALSQLHYGMQLGRTMQRAGMSALALPFRPVRAVARPLRRNAHERRTGAEKLVREHAHQAAGNRAREAAAASHAIQYAGAEAVLHRAHSKDPLVRRSVDAAELSRARWIAGRGPDAPAMSDHDVQRWIGQRRWDIENRRWDDDANLRAAGIDPRAHRSLRPDGDALQREMFLSHRRQSQQQMHADRELLARVPDERRAAPMSRRERRTRLDSIEDEVGRKQLKQQLAEQKRGERRRVRASRRRARVYR